MAHMNLTMYVEALRERLVAAAEPGGPEARAAVESVAPALDAAVRLVMLEVLSAAADEITSELAPGAVDVRLRGSDPEFVVTPSADEADDAPSGSAGSPAVLPAGDDDGATSRFNLRLPEGLKARIEEAARREGLSLNAWLVRAAAGAVEGTRTQMPRRSPSGSQRYTGWVR
jgi:hypothetical protein